jgi:hypothetical protein
MTAKQNTDTRHLKWGGDPINWHNPVTYIWKSSNFYKSIKKILGLMSAIFHFFTFSLFDVKQHKPNPSSPIEKKSLNPH